MKRKSNRKKSKNKKMSINKIFFITVGLLGLILLVFGLQFNGTLSDEIQEAGIAGLGIFAIWAVFNIATAYIERKELENL